MHSGTGLRLAACAVVLCGPFVPPANAAQRPDREAPAAEAQQLADRAMEWLRRGEDAASAGEKRAAYERGRDLARQAVELDDSNADAHFALFANNGRLLLMDRVKANPITLMKASRSLHRALELNPNHTNALAARGALYRQLPWVLGGSLSKAERDLTRAIALDPNAVGARLELAETYCDMGHPDRAPPLLRKAAELAARMGKRRQLERARRRLAELDAQLAHRR